MGTVPAGKRGPKRWIDIQGLLTSDSGMMHHNEKEIEPVRQETSVDG